jgi:hypothetical protein
MLPLLHAFDGSRVDGTAVRAEVSREERRGDSERRNELGASSGW